MNINIREIGMHNRVLLTTVKEKVASQFLIRITIMIKTVTIENIKLYTRDWRDQLTQPVWH